MRPVHLVVTCEHAGNIVPEDYQHLFDRDPEILHTHQGIDIGVLPCARQIADLTNTRLFYTEISRLLVDCNRSVSNPQIFSVFTRDLDPATKAHLIDHYYQPYREQVEKEIRSLISDQVVLHLSVHSFTPVWEGKERAVDIGLLFDDARPLEKELCTRWKKELEGDLPEMTISLNMPYKGSDDGFTTFLRNSLPVGQYLGIELEINQRWIGSEFVGEVIKKAMSAMKKSVGALSSGLAHFSD